MISPEDNSRWKELGRQIQIFIQWSISSAIDAAFLALWVFFQWLLDVKIIQEYKISNIDLWVLLSFQIIFAISTVIPVMIFIYTDIRIMFIRAKRRIQQEIKVGEEDRHDET